MLTKKQQTILKKMEQLTDLIGSEIKTKNTTFNSSYDTDSNGIEELTLTIEDKCEGDSIIGFVKTIILKYDTCKDKILSYKLKQKTIWSEQFQSYNEGFKTTVFNTNQVRTFEKYLTYFIDRLKVQLRILSNENVKLPSKMIEILKENEELWLIYPLIKGEINYKYKYLDYSNIQELANAINENQNINITIEQIDDILRAVIRNKDGSLSEVLETNIKGLKGLLQCAIRDYSDSYCFYLKETEADYIHPNGRLVCVMVKR